jgi:hypothetical protein
MSNPPRISLIYRPVRIGWVVEDGSLSQLVTATSWSTCLWGGRFNPIIPMADAELANNLIATFGVDVLIPVIASEATSAFIAKYPHLHMWQKSADSFLVGSNRLDSLRFSIGRKDQGVFPRIRCSLFSQFFAAWSDSRVVDWGFKLGLPGNPLRVVAFLTVRSGRDWRHLQVIWFKQLA